MRSIDLRTGFTEQNPFGVDIPLSYTETQISTPTPTAGLFNSVVIIQALEVGDLDKKYVQLRVNTTDASINIPAESYYYVRENISFNDAENTAYGFYDELYKNVPVFSRDWTANSYESVSDFPLDISTFEDLLPKFYEDEIHVDP